MHFLLTAIGSYGDVHPMIGLGSTLRQRGHEVEVLTSGYFEEEVTNAGLDIAPIGTREDYLELTRHPDLWRPRKGLSVVLRHAVGHYLEPLYDQIASRYRPGQTVIAAHGLDLASRVARDALGAPVAAVVYAPMALWSSSQPPVLPVGAISPRLPRWWNQLQFEVGLRFGLRPLVEAPVNRLRRRLGLAPVGRLLPDWWYGVDATLCLFPDWFAPPPDDWPANRVLTGFPLWDGGEGTRLSTACLEFLEAGDAPVVFTPGTANRHSTSYFAAAVEACGRLGRRGVLLTKFEEQVPAKLPPTVRRFEFEPLTKLLPKVAALVHHGGIGSSSQALASGVPQLVRPLAFDQPDNARRLVELGVAEAIGPRRFNAATASGALQRLAESKSVQASVQRLSSRCDGHADRARACDVLERLRP